MKILMAYGDYLHTPERKAKNEYGALGYYRIVKIAEQIKSHEVKVIGKEIIEYGDSLENQWDNIFKQYDVFWTNYFADDRAAAAMFYYAKVHGKKVVLDIDDNYLDVPESNLSYDKFKPKERDRAMLSTILSFADVIVTTTEPLRDRLFEHFKKTQNIEKNIVVIPNFNDAKDWDFTPAEKHTDKIVIGYTGSNSHKDDLKMVMPAMAEVMKKHDNVYFEIMGAIAKTEIKDYFKGSGMTDDCLKRISLLPSTPTFKEYPQYLSEQKWNIGICPLVDSAFTRAKSHIKWMEYSMYKIPVIASRVYPYFMELKGRELIEDGVTGLLCRPNEWVKALEKLITDEKFRIELGEHAFNHINKHWQWSDAHIDEQVRTMLEN